jgi:MFS family permease
MVPRMTEPNRYGWMIVALCFAALSVTQSSRAALGLVMPAWEQELGWTRSFVSTGAALALVVIAAVAPVVGNAVDRMGPRRLLTLGMLVTGLGVGATALMRSQWQFLLTFSGIAAIGFGMVANHTVSTTIAQHFTERRGLATGAATAGSTAGQLLIVPLLALVMSTIGWRASFAASAVALLLLAPIAWLAIRRPHVAATRSAAAEPLGARLRTLAASPVFHALLWSFTICGFTTAGVIEVHLIPYAVACGFAPFDGSLAYGVLSGFNMLGMVAAGWLSDRVNRPLLLGAIYIGRGLAFLVLMQIAGSPTLLFGFAAAFGIFDYATVPVTASLVASHLGVRIMGLAMGLLSAGHALGGAVGAFAGGRLYDMFARYDFVWLAALVLALAAGLMCFTIRERRSAVQPA